MKKEEKKEEERHGKRLEIDKICLYTCFTQLMVVNEGDWWSTHEKTQRRADRRRAGIDSASSRRFVERSNGPSLAAGANRSRPSHRQKKSSGDY